MSNITTPDQTFRLGTVAPFQAITDIDQCVRSLAESLVTSPAWQKLSTMDSEQLEGMKLKVVLHAEISPLKTDTENGNPLESEVAA
jgi:hypothetical protein